MKLISFLIWLSSVGLRLVYDCMVVRMCFYFWVMFIWVVCG